MTKLAQELSDQYKPFETDSGVGLDTVGKKGSVLRIDSYSPSGLFSGTMFVEEQVISGPGWVVGPEWPYQSEEPILKKEQSLTEGLIEQTVFNGPIKKI